MIVVPWKWVDATSESDRAALETALRLDPDVTVVSVGSAAAERGLREALAAGAREAVRIDAPGGLRSDAVGRALATVCRAASWVICGDASRDRGSGSVPAFIADELGIGQALGLVAVEPDGNGDPNGRTNVRLTALRVVRRLDGGRREVLRAVPPAVLSVEGSVARLRRASLPAELAAQTHSIDVRPGPDGPLDRPDSVTPYRPRARELPEPAGEAAERIRQLTAGTGTTANLSTARNTVALGAVDAAARIVETLRLWSYLPTTTTTITPGPRPPGPPAPVDTPVPGGPR